MGAHPRNEATQQAVSCSGSSSVHVAGNIDLEQRAHVLLRSIKRQHK